MCRNIRQILAASACLPLTMIAVKDPPPQPLPPPLPPPPLRSKVQTNHRDKALWPLSISFKSLQTSLLVVQQIILFLCQYLAAAAAAHEWRGPETYPAISAHMNTTTRTLAFTLVHLTVWRCTVRPGPADSLNAFFHIQVVSSNLS